MVREGKQESINASELVPGDLVVLEEGDLVPADLRLVFCAQLEIVESILTGESVGIKKNTEAIRAVTRKLPLGDCLGNAFMSTMVAKGRGKGVVVRTGAKTEVFTLSFLVILDWILIHTFGRLAKFHRRSRRRPTSKRPCRSA